MSFVVRAMRFITELLTDNLVLEEGKSTLILLGCVSTPFFFFSATRFFGIIFIGVAFLFLLFFFRNPQRMCQQAKDDASLLIAPCDGKVVVIETINDPRFPEYSQKISIFLSPLDVHVNWICMAGTVTQVTYHQGSFYPAFLPKSSELNERNDIVIRNQRGDSIRLRQITGTLARTIACWVRVGDRVAVGEKYGMMKFGSRIDLFLPASVSVNVTLQQYVWGGETIIGRWDYEQD